MIHLATHRRHGLLLPLLWQGTRCIGIHKCELRSHHLVPTDSLCVLLPILSMFNVARQARNVIVVTLYNIISLRRAMALVNFVVAVALSLAEDWCLVEDYLRIANSDLNATPWRSVACR